ncbi:craniofacial development protein 2-like [Vanessa cardui]|uniref:craniofacial development protein 2-like n=1 Tax=Vanessa cardui TaxID=171605 RepID=UPI001F1334C7|nr:craniofacial development protein 2-like [Vanessa cardui]
MRQSTKVKRNNARASPLSDVGEDTASNARAYPLSDGKPRDRNMLPMSQVRIATWNIGSMNVRSIELIDILERRHINICCVQETRWKGAKSLNIGKGYKLIYNGKDDTKNGVGIILDQNLSQNIVEVNRISDRIIGVKMAFEKQACLNVISVYAPQSGCSDADKQEFWDDLSVYINTIPTKEQRLICGDLNGHVGLDRSGFRGHHGGFGYGKQNNEGITILEFAVLHNLAVVNTFFQKKDEHLITYKSGKFKTQIDYILADKSNIKQFKDCKVIPGEPLTSQHRLLIASMKLKRPIKIQTPKTERIKWQEIHSEKGSAFQEGIRNFMTENPPGNDSPNTTWSKFENRCLTLAKNVLGISKGPPRNGKDSKWWNSATKENVAEKKRRFKIWQETGLDQDKELYKEAKKNARRTVAIEKDKADVNLYRRLELATDTEIYKIAKQRHQNSKDIITTKYIKDEKGVLLTDDKDICRRWYHYYNELLNEEFPRKPEKVEP